MPKTEGNSAASTSSYCFSWDNYQNHFSQVVRQLLDEECMVDVTLYASGERIHAHRLVLCACSDLLADIFSQVNDEHVTVILDDIDPKDVRSIVEFIYNGEVRTPVENINNFLAAAQSLKIHGLMDIGPVESEENEIQATCDSDDGQLLDDYVMDDNENDEDEYLEKVSVDNADDSKVVIFNEDSSESRKRRKSVSKKDYTGDMLIEAINDIKSGTSLLEAAAKYHIPRSTLYMRAKSMGIQLNTHKSDYTSDDMKAAINAVIAGSSLQNAADSFRIPKTVLWRRIQKEGHVYRNDNKRNYDAEQREAAIKALERGEALTKVAQEYQIPKTTLFRDKLRLVGEGKIPVTDMKKRKSYIEGEKRIMLEKAVDACKKGIMSQAAASLQFNIPKTTIWRRLQKDACKTDFCELRRTGKKGHYQMTMKKDDDVRADDLNDSNFEVYCEDDSEMEQPYSSISDDQTLNLPEDELNLQGDPIIVVGDQDGNEQSYIMLEDNSSFDMKS